MKTVLLGNAGAGKSTLAKKLIGDRAIALLSLDDITWNPHVQRKPLTESIDLLKAFIEQHDEWIIEGCYGDL
ncbi:MAG: shikimate kinase, partial [Cyanobacteria bacterium P01_H01_bin.153]